MTDTGEGQKDGNLLREQCEDGGNTMDGIQWTGALTLVFTYFFSYLLRGPFACMYVCVLCACSAYQGQKRVSAPLELELGPNGC